MKLIIGFLNACAAIVRISFPRHSTPTQEAFHAVTSYNDHNEIKGTFPKLEIDYSQVMVGRGNLPAAEQASCAPAGKGNIRFTWMATSERPGVRSDETVMLLAYFPSKKYAADSLQGSIRKEGEAVLTVPPDFAGEEAHCCLCFANLPNLAQNPSAEWISLFNSEIFSLARYSVHLTVFPLLP